MQKSTATRCTFFTSILRIFHVPLSSESVYSMFSITHFRYPQLSMIFIRFCLIHHAHLLAVQLHWTRCTGTFTTLLSISNHFLSRVLVWGHWWPHKEFLRNIWCYGGVSWCKLARSAHFEGLRRTCLNTIGKGRLKIPKLSRRT